MAAAAPIIAPMGGMVQFKVAFPARSPKAMAPVYTTYSNAWSWTMATGLWYTRWPVSPKGGLIARD